LPRAPRHAAPGEGQSWRGASLRDAPAHECLELQTTLRSTLEVPNKPGELASLADELRGPPFELVGAGVL
jgi:hypothetical protein